MIVFVGKFARIFNLTSSGLLQLDNGVEAYTVCNTAYALVYVALRKRFLQPAASVNCSRFVSV